MNNLISGCNATIAQRKKKIDAYVFLVSQVIISSLFAIIAWHYYPIIASTKGGTALQYARYVYTALAIGLASTVATFFIDAIRGSHLAVSRGFNFFGAAIVIAYTVYFATHDVRYEDEHVDVAAVVTLLCGLLSAAASFADLRYDQPESNEAALRRRLLLCADLPLIAGTIAIIIIRLWAYTDVANGYFEWFNLNIWDGVSYTNWHTVSKAIGNVHLAMRLNFWNGFSTGAIAIQLSAFQIVGTMLRLEYSCAPVEGQPKAGSPE
jgi:hypothetical protein